MTRENVKKNMDIISAFADGRDIQMLNERGKWVDLTEREGLPMGTLEEKPNIFRIKPESKYRPFKNAEECWTEMLKHQPFGWVKSTLFKDLALVQRVTTLYVEINRDIIDYKDTLEKFTFADGTPFGVKVEE